MMATTTLVNLLSMAAFGFAIVGFFALLMLHMEITKLERHRKDKDHE